MIIVKGNTMKRLAASASALAVLTLLSACGRGDGEITAADEEGMETAEVAEAALEAPFPQVDIDMDASPEERNLALSEAFLARNAERPEVTLTVSGLQYEVLDSGAPDAPSPGLDSWACVHYTGYLPSGEVFDSSRDGLPLALPLSGIIQGWREALPMMVEGDRWMLFLPPDLGYGRSGAGGVIPPNAALVFDVALLRVLRVTDIAVLPGGQPDPEWDCAVEHNPNAPATDDGAGADTD